MESSLLSSVSQSGAPGPAASPGNLLNMHILVLLTQTLRWSPPLYSTSPPRGSGALQFENQWSMLAWGPGRPRWAYLGPADVIVKGACGFPHTPSPVIGCPCKLQQPLISKSRQVSWQSLGGCCHHQSVYLPGCLIVMGHGREICIQRYPTQHQQAGTSGSRPFSFLYYSHASHVPFLSATCLLETG